MAANCHSGFSSYPSCSGIITPNESGGAGFLALLTCLGTTDGQRHLACSTPCHRGTLLIHVPWHHIQTEKFSCEKHMIHSKAEENITPQDQTVPLCQDCLKYSLPTGQHSSLTQSYLG